VCLLVDAVGSTPWCFSSHGKSGKIGNRRTFDGICLSLSQLLQRIKDEGEEWIGAGFRKLAALFVGVQ
jgi:hypothetical protein